MGTAMNTGGSGFFGLGLTRPSPTRSSRKASYSLSIVSRSLEGTKLKTAPGRRCLQSAAAEDHYVRIRNEMPFDRNNLLT